MPQPVMLKKLKLNNSMKTYRPLRTNTQKRCPFHYRDWNAKEGSQETPGVTGKFGLGIRNEAGQILIRVLPRKCTGHNKHPLQITQERLYTWTSPDGQH